MPITERIKEKASAIGHTFASIERELNFANGSIRKWDNSVPSSDKLLKVAHILGVTTDWLLTGEETIASSQQLTHPESEAMLYEIIDAYRVADKEQRRAILQAALGTNNKPKGYTVNKH
jgi:transcriptional regulator with XRE-family HTH domain